jgi:protoporphyrinogen oxidase
MTAPQHEGAAGSGDPAAPVLIVGAGIAGLAAATWLRARGYPVRIIEATHRPGGRAVTITRPDGSGDRVDVGTQYFHSNYRRARRLIAGAGLTPRRVRGRTRFFDDRVAGGSFTTGHRLPIIRAGGVLANLGLVGKGLARMLRHPIDPYAPTAYAGADRVSAQAVITDPFEREFTLRTLIAAGALVEPDGAPGFEHAYLHLIRLMRIVLMTEYLVLDEGIGALHEALAARLDIAYGTPAARVLWDGRVRGVALSGGGTIKASHVVLAVPPHRAGALLPPDWQAERQFLLDIPHPPAVIVTLFLDRALQPGVWSYVMRPNPERLVSFCVDAAQKAPGMVPSGRAALQAWICWPASGRVADLSDAALIEAVMAELRENFPDIDGWVSSSHVMRHAQAVPQSTPGHARRVAAFLDAIHTRQGLAVCGDFLSGGYLESALASAELAVARVAAGSAA